jgi:hypothetical protein
MSLSADFARLFRGRLDAFGTDAGGCERPREDWATYEDYVTRVERHLSGEHPMGVYPVFNLSHGHENFKDISYSITAAIDVCSWGCIDWDTPDAWDHSIAAWETYRQLGITTWIERSRSKGYHLWVFASEPVPARVMRRAGLAVCQISGASAKEVNPKQERLEGDAVGNYVRLPYPGGMYHGQQGGQLVLDVREGGEYLGPIIVEVFVKAALESRATLAQLEAVANLYVEPVVERPTIIERWALPDWHIDAPAERRMSGLAWTIYSNGPLDGSDRSGTLYKLAVELLKGRKHVYWEAVALMRDANSRWGKGEDWFERNIEGLMTNAGW